MMSKQNYAFNIILMFLNSKKIPVFSSVRLIKAMLGYAYEYYMKKKVEMGGSILFQCKKKDFFYSELNEWQKSKQNLCDL